MEDFKEVYEDIRNEQYSISDHKSQELLFTHNVDPEDNLKKLSRLTTLRTIDKGIKFLKIGLYLAVFEDLNAFLFFYEAQKIFKKINNSESEEFLNFINNENLNSEIYLKGTDHEGCKEIFETFKKSKDLNEIIENYNTIRDEILFSNYLSGKSVRRIIKIIEEESIRKFKSNLKNYKVQYNFLENKKKNELIDLKERLRQQRKDNLNKRVKEFLKENRIDIFPNFSKINKSTITSKKAAIEGNYQNIMASIEDQKKEKIAAMAKKVLLQTIAKCNDQLKKIIAVEENYTSFENIENINFERDMISETKEIDIKYEELHNKLKDEFRGILNYKRILFETIRKTQNATLFGKDMVRIFSAKGDRYSDFEMWNGFMQMEIIEQDYEDYPVIRNNFNAMKKKAVMIVKKSLRMFEHPDQIFEEIERIENNIN